MVKKDGLLFTAWGDSRGKEGNVLCSAEKV